MNGTSGRSLSLPTAASTRITRVGVRTLPQEVCQRVHRIRPELARLLHGGRIIRQVGIEDAGLGIKRQVGDSDDCGIAYAVRNC